MSKDNTIHEIAVANMQRLRAERGWNKSELARQSGIDQSHVSNIENGKRQMGLETLSVIAKALGVEPYELIREYDVEKLGLRHRLDMVAELHPIKKQAIEQMLNAFLKEGQF